MSDTTQLTNILAFLYPDVVDAKRVVADAGLDEKFITFDDKAINNWFNILTEAQRHDKVEAILQIASNEYGENTELIRAYLDYVKAQRRRYVPVPPINQRLAFILMIIGGFILSAVIFGVWGYNLGLNRVPASTPISPAGPASSSPTLTATQPITRSIPPLTGSLVYAVANNGRVDVWILFRAYPTSGGYASTMCNTSCTLHIKDRASSLTATNLIVSDVVTDLVSSEITTLMVIPRLTAPLYHFGFGPTQLFLLGMSFKNSQVTDTIKADATIDELEIMVNKQKLDYTDIRMPYNPLRLFPESNPTANSQ